MNKESKYIEEIVKLTQARRRTDTEVFKLGSAADAGRYAEELIGANAAESLVVIALDVKLQVTAVREVSRGAPSYTLMPVREILQTALLTNASSIMIAHNHPSGDLHPSDADVQAIVALQDACIDCGITLLDALIVSDNDFYSSRENDGTLLQAMA